MMPKLKEIKKEYRRTAEELADDEIEENDKEDDTDEEDEEPRRSKRTKKQLSDKKAEQQAKDLARAEELVKKKARVVKKFSDGKFYGTVTGVNIFDDNEDVNVRVEYDDGDLEDISMQKEKSGPNKGKSILP